jgi:cell fate (sporulation/competence/biofilm development) regulator YmcA (YheA/YmcA/DUF963 family)
MTREYAIKVVNTLANLEAIERAIDALPFVPEFEDLTKDIYDKLYQVLDEAKKAAENQLEDL